MHKNDNCTTHIAHHYTNIHTTICTYIVTVCQNLSFFKVKIFQEVSQLYIPILYNQDWTITCNTWVLFSWHWSQMLLLSFDLTITGLQNKIISMTLVFLQELATTYCARLTIVLLVYPRLEFSQASLTNSDTVTSVELLLLFFFNFSFCLQNFDRNDFFSSSKIYFEGLLRLHQ